MNNQVSISVISLISFFFALVLWGSALYVIKIDARKNVAATSVQKTAAWIAYVVIVLTSLAGICLIVQKFFSLVVKIN